MPREDIIEGLRYALANGEPLDKAMMSFFNAGYSKEEIEEAARFMQAPSISQATPMPPASSATPSTPANPQGYQPINPPSQMSAPPPIQRVSAYGARSKSSGKGITIALVLLLLVLLGILVSVFMFRDSIAGLLG